MIRSRPVAAVGSQTAGLSHPQLPVIRVYEVVGLVDLAWSTMVLIAAPAPAVGVAEW